MEEYSNKDDYLSSRGLTVTRQQGRPIDRTRHEALSRDSYQRKKYERSGDSDYHDNYEDEDNKY